VLDPPGLPDDAIIAEWSEPVERVRGRRASTFSLYFFLAFPLSLVLAVGLSEPLFLTLLGVESIILIFCAVVLARESRVPSAVAGLMDLPPNGLQYPVSVVYRTRDLTYGDDEGILTFDANWAIFEGLQSRFSLSRDHVRVTRNWPQADGNNLGEGRVLMIGFAVEGRPFRVDIRRLFARDGITPVVQHDFYWAAAHWDWLPEMSSGRPLYPPLVPSPKVVKNLQQKRIYPFVVGCVAAAAFTLPTLKLFGPIGWAIQTCAIVASAVIGWADADKRLKTACRITRGTPIPQQQRNSPRLASEPGMITPAAVDPKEPTLN
jgi:hypothetical protein